MLILIEDGELAVEVDGGSYNLYTGDTLHFKASLGHRWKNTSDQSVQFLVIGTLSQAMRSILGDRLRRRDIPVKLMHE